MEHTNEHRGRRGGGKGFPYGRALAIPIIEESPIFGHPPLSQGSTRDRCATRRGQSTPSACRLWGAMGLSSVGTGFPPYPLCLSIFSCAWLLILFHFSFPCFIGLDILRALSLSCTTGSYILYYWREQAPMDKCVCEEVPWMRPQHGPYHSVQSPFPVLFFSCVRRRGKTLLGEPRFTGSHVGGRTRHRVFSLFCFTSTSDYRGVFAGTICHAGDHGSPCCGLSGRCLSGCHHRLGVFAV